MLRWLCLCNAILGGFVFYRSLHGEVSISAMIGRFIFEAFLIAPFIGFQCVGIGAIVGTVNSITNGGVGRGFEWIFIVGIASTIGAWQWQIGKWGTLEFGISGGMLGGMVGWATWRLFRNKGEERGLKKNHFLLYAIAFIGVIMVFRIYEAFMILVLD